MSWYYLSGSFVAFALSLYVLLDGFDLGVGMLLYGEKSQARRDLMVASISPVWDANETWMIMAGVALLAAFPVAYSAVLPALYLPLIVMLLSLGLRGVAFEFREQNLGSRPVWDRVFATGSLFAAMTQGIVAGALLVGVKTQNGVFVGGPFDWLSPFSLVTGLGMVVAYAIRGASWLILKGDAPIRHHGWMVVRFMTPLLAIMAAGGLWWSLSIPQIQEAWSTRGLLLGLCLTAFVGCAVTLILLSFRQSASNRGTEMLVGVGMFVSAILLVVGTLYPYIVPWNLTLAQAASPETSQKFLMIGAFLVTPVVLAYNAFAYYVFRGPSESPVSAE